MSVRYRPRGFDLRPGSRVVYVFENEITRRKRIPRKVSIGVLHGIHRDGRGNAQGRVTFDNAPLENGHPRVATIPVEVLALESSPQLAAPGLPADYYSRLRPLGLAAKSKIRDQEWEARFARYKSIPWGIDADLWDRARAHFGSDPYWWTSRYARRVAAGKL